MPLIVALIIPPPRDIFKSFFDIFAYIIKSMSPATLLRRKKAAGLEYHIKFLPKAHIQPHTLANADGWVEITLFMEWNQENLHMKVTEYFAEEGFSKR